MSENAVTADFELRSQAVERRAAAAQKLNPPFFIMATNQTLARDSIASHAANHAAKKRGDKPHHVDLCYGRDGLSKAQLIAASDVIITVNLSNLFRRLQKRIGED